MSRRKVQCIDVLALAKSRRQAATQLVLAFPEPPRVVGLNAARIYARRCAECEHWSENRCEKTGYQLGPRQVCCAPGGRR